MANPLTMTFIGAHQNTLENLPTTLFSTLIAGLVYPKFAGSAAAFWSVARVIYTIGYGSGEPDAVSLLQALCSISSQR